jgi:hypothetical protein
MHGKVKFAGGRKMIQHFLELSSKIIKYLIKAAPNSGGV